jgi:hypothetical protein
MKYISNLVVLVLGCILFSGIGVSANPQRTKPCVGNPRLVGECFKVHGRYQAYNGNPTFRIWRIGTNRILGITDAEYNDDDMPWLPKSLRTRWGFGVAVYGDFLVCPFEKERPGNMQMVCVESAEHLVIVDNRTEAERNKK